MIDESGHYLYFYGTLLFASFTALFFMLGGPQRKMMLLGGAVTVPFAPLGMLYTGEYWTPHRLFEIPFGVEDAVWLFAMGATAWFCATLLMQKSVTVALEWRRFLIRLSLVAVPALLSAALLMRVGVSWTSAAYIIPCAATAIVLVLNPRLAVLAAFGGVIAGIVCSVETRLCFVLWPDFLSFWTEGTVWKVPVLGVPLGDIVFAVIMGACHPVVTAYAADARIGDGKTSAIRLATPDFLRIR